MRISAFCSFKNTTDTGRVINQDENLQYVWCLLAVVSLEHPALCYLGPVTLWKKTDGKAKIEKQ